MSEHEGMMTRREVLEWWADVNCAAHFKPTMTAYATEEFVTRRILGAGGVHKQDLAHELALMMNEERGEDEWRVSERT